jgi:PAS domain-containing protein
VPNVGAFPLLFDRAADRQLHAALQHASIVVYTCDLDLKYTWLANSFPGLTIREMIGRRDDELLSPETAAPMTAFKRRVLASGRPATVELAYLHGTETLLYEVRAEPLAGAGGTTTGLSVLAIDITARKKAELEAVENAKRYRALAAAT